ncbi:DIAP1-like protein, partial [Mya arenaria]
GNGNGIVLARNGFYHHPEDGPNSTRCFACGFKYNEWDMFDNVDEIHRKRSPNCPLLHGNIGEGTRRNISIDSDDVPRRRPVQQQTAVTAEPTGRNVQDSEPVRSTSSSLSSSAAAAATSGASSVSSVAATSTVSSAGSFIHSHLPSQSRNPIATSLTRVSGLGNFGRPVATTTQPVTVPSSAKPQSLFSAPSTSASAVASSASAFGGLATRVADTHISSAEGDQHSGFTRMQPTSDPNNTDRMYNLNPTTQIRGMGMVDEPYNEISVPPPQQGIRVSGNHPPSSLFGGGPVGAGGFTTGQPQSMPVSGHTQVSELRSSSVPLVQGLSGSPGLTPHQKARPPPPSTQQALSYQQRGQGLGGGSGPEGAPPDRARGTGLPGLDPDLTAGIHIVSPRHPDYNTLTSRINSFSGWPSHLDQNPRMMGEAGFFYVGVADFCRCYACGGGLRNWQPADNNSQDPFDCETGRQLMSNDFPQARTRRAIRALRITHGRDPTPVEVLDWMSAPEHASQWTHTEDSESATPSAILQPTSSITHSSTTTTTTTSNLTTAPTGSINVSVTSSTSYFSRGASQENTKREATPPTVTNQREISPSGGKIREANTGEGKDSRMEDDVRVGNSDKQAENNSQDPLDCETGRQLMSMGFPQARTRRAIRALRRIHEDSESAIPAVTSQPTTSITHSSTTTTTTITKREATSPTFTNQREISPSGGKIRETNTGEGKDSRREDDVRKKKKKKGKGGKSSQEVGPGTTEGASGGPEEEENNEPNNGGGKKKKKKKGKGGKSSQEVGPGTTEGASGGPEEEENNESPYNRPSPMIGGESVGACAVTADDGTQIRQENEKLLKKLKCGICMERQVGTTLLPCGHLVTCDRCASRLSKCPICRTKIKGSVKTFMT